MRIANHDGDDPRAVLRLQRIILVALFVVSLPILTPYLRGDGIAYYAYVASAVVDGDLRFENEFRRSDPAGCWIYFDEEGNPNPNRDTPTGHMSNYHSAGPSLLWAPFFVAAHAGVLVQNAVSPSEKEIPADGFSRPYLWLCAFGSALFGFLGLLWSHSIAARLVSPWPAFWATLGIWCAGNLAVYMYFLPFLAHPGSVMVNAAFLWVWRRSARDVEDLPTIRSASAWLVLGVLTGLTFSVYYLGALIGIFVVADVAVMAQAWYRTGAWRDLPEIGRRFALPGLLGLLLGFLPHAIPKWIIYGNPFALGYGLQWQPENPFLFEVLFSSNHGLLAWHPVYGLALIGLIGLVGRFPRFAICSLLFFVSCTWLIASKPNWAGGSAFGNRYFLLLVPVFVAGLASFLEGVPRFLSARFGLGDRTCSLASLGLVALLALWNAGFLVQWATNMVPNRGPVSFQEVAVNQVNAVPAKILRIAVPFFSDRDGMIDRIEKEDLEEFEVLERGSVCVGVGAGG